jgi:bifunctional enzyme CysN/CysC
MDPDAADRWLEARVHRPPLRFITCGSVDDGKSTLIGRMLYDAQLVLDDQLAALAEDSRRVGTRGGDLDFALLVDGLAAEREQGITIDVAYRFFATAKRRFIVADTPGHEQYTRNMVTGASTADVAVLLVDAERGLSTQTRRHARLVALVGIRRVVLAVNKMDRVDWSRARFESLAAEFSALATPLGLEATPVPVAAVHGDNVLARSERMPWYRGPTLLEYLETVEVGDHAGALAFRLPVQWVNRPDATFRGFSGQITSGTVRPGDAVTVLPSGGDARVARIVTADGDLPAARAGDSVTLLLDRELDVSRGDVLAAADAAPDVASQFGATLVWLDEAPMLPGRSYLLKVATATATATVAPLRYRLDVDSGRHDAAARLEVNDIGSVELELDRPVAFERYALDRALGGFILIDRLTNATVGAGFLEYPLRRSANVHWQALDVDRAFRARQNGQQPCVVWLTGLSGAGKSTIANRVERRLAADGRRTYLLDGDNVRHGLNKDLGFTAEDRVENVRRVAEVARLMVDAGLIVLVSLISPFRAERAMARGLFGPDEFFEVHVDVPLAVAEARDPKGLYAKARAGRLPNFTGIDSPYEPPEQPDLVVDGAAEPTEAADRIVALLTARGRLRAAG